MTVVVGAGAQTPLGLTLAQTSFLLRAGFAAMGPAPLGPEGSAVTICGQVALDETLVGPERLLALATPALTEACAPLEPVAPRARLVLCLDALEEAEARRVSDGVLAKARAYAPEIVLERSLRREAGACLALPKALAEFGKSIDVVILGGVHSDHDPRAIGRLLAQDRLYDHENLDAVVPGEAAAFVVLTSAAFGRRHRLPELAMLDGVGSGMEAARIDNDEPAATARALTAAMRQATATLEPAGQRAGWVLSDLSFEAWRLREWQSVFLRATSVLGPPYFVDNVAQRLGALGGAAGPLLLALACEAWRAGHAPSPRALALLGSDGGERGALAISRALSISRVGSEGR